MCASCAVIPSAASKTKMTMRARSMALRAEMIESFSAGSSVFPLRRMPAVSTKTYSRSPRVTRTSMATRVDAPIFRQQPVHAVQDEENEVRVGDGGQRPLARPRGETSGGVEVEPARIHEAKRAAVAGAGRDLEGIARHPGAIVDEGAPHPRD